MRKRKLKEETTVSGVERRGVVRNVIRFVVGGDFI